MRTMGTKNIFCILNSFYTEMKLLEDTRKKQGKDYLDEQVKLIEKYEKIIKELK